MYGPVCPCHVRLCGERRRDQTERHQNEQRVSPFQAVSSSSVKYPNSMAGGSLKYLGASSTHVEQEVNDQKKGEADHQGGYEGHAPFQLGWDGLPPQDQHDPEGEGQNNEDKRIA